MVAIRFTVTGRHQVSLRSTVNSHGWVALQPWIWNNETGVLSRTERVLSGSLEKVSVRQIDNNSYAVTSSGGDKHEIETFVRRWLSLDWDPSEALQTARCLDTYVQNLIANGSGRFLRGSTFFEDYLKTVCTVQINWKGTIRMAQRLVIEIGGGSVPTPLEVLHAGEEDLRLVASLGFRAKGIILSTQMMLENGLIDAQGNGDEQRLSYENLLKLFGVGAYAARHLRVLLHDYSQIPVDSEVSKFFLEQHGIEQKDIDAFEESWGDYRFLVYKLRLSLA